MTRFSMIFLVTVVLMVNDGNCWKPISGPPASFTIRQTHPSFGNSVSSHSQNTISADVSSGSGSGFSSGSSLEDHDIHIGNAPGSRTIETADGALLGGSDISEYHGFKGGNIFDAAPVGGAFSEDTCSVDKYAFDYEGTVHYKNKLPKLDQFTICFWSRFTNHTGDHTLFTYSVDHEPREIQIWIANSKGSSYISMAVHGQSLYRLNYPLKMRVWHHLCSSWNGKTGEWQVWVKGERVGRGFHNRLIKYVIPGNGILFSGGPSITGHTAIGLHFEMTLLQIYKVALTAGKAHRDHKHHHVHHFNHDGLVSTTTTRSSTLRPSQLPMNPLLANGQIPTRVRINLAMQAQAQQQQQQPPVQTQPGISSQIIGGHGGLLAVPQQATINTNFVNGQFHAGGRLLTQQILSTQPRQSLQQQSTLTFPGASITRPSGSSISGQTSQFLQLTNPSSVQYIDGSDPASRYLFKRESKNTTDNSSSSNNNKEIKKREIKPISKDTDKDKLNNSSDSEVKTKKRRDVTSSLSDRNVRKDRKFNKRGLVMLGDGTIVDDALLAHGYQFEGLAQFGLPAFKDDLRNRMNIEDEIKEHDREPAEDEVRAVLSVCTSCDEEPFKGAIALAWKDVHAAIDQTLKGRSVGGCGFF